MYLQDRCLIVCELPFITIFPECDSALFWKDVFLTADLKWDVPVCFQMEGRS